MQSLMYDGFLNESSFSSIYTQKPIGPRFKSLFLCCLFLSFLIKIILLKFIQRDDAYGQCELYDAHLWQVSDHYILSLTFAYIAMHWMKCLYSDSKQCRMP